MGRYAYINDGKIVKIINTRKEIPEFMWKKKGLLPVIIETIEIEEGQQPLKEKGLYIEKNRVLDLRVMFYHINTLEEVKEKKIKSMRNYLSSKFPATHKQLNSALGIYDDIESNEIKNNIIKWRNYFNNFEEQILACEDIESVNKINYITEEDKDFFNNI